MNNQQKTDLQEIFNSINTISFDDFKAILFNLDNSSSNMPDNNNEYFQYSPFQSLLLIERYPFLMPVNIFSQQPIFDYDKAKEYVIGSNEEDDVDLSGIYSNIDSMPYGWNYRFGLEMIEDINNLLLSSSTESPYENYRIDDIKEKYGTLRYYDSGAPQDVADYIGNIVCLYEIFSGKVCIECGSIDNIKTTSGYLIPVCKEDYIKLSSQNKQDADTKYKKYSNQFSKLSDIIAYSTYDKDNDTWHDHSAQEIIDKVKEYMGSEKTLHIEKLANDIISQNK